MREACNTADKLKHKVAIIYFTETLTLLDSVADHLLLTSGDKTKELSSSEIIEDTFLLRLFPDLSIISYREIISNETNVIKTILS